MVIEPMLNRLQQVLLLGLTLWAGCPAAGEGSIKVAGADHYLVLKDDGAVWGFGECFEGKLGPVEENCKYVPKPKQIVLPGKAIDIAASSQTSFALMEGGTVLSWGGDMNGELGRGPADRLGKNRAPQSVPALIPGLTGVVQISARESSAAALKSDGSVWIWGARVSNDYRDTPIVAPTRVQGLPPMQAVSVGRTHTLALARDGSLYAWGSNTHGQLGDGTIKSSNEPVRVNPIPPVAAIAAGWKNSLAVLTDGTVRAWGGNASATMGNGERVSDISEPGAINQIPTVVAGVTGAKTATTDNGTVIVLLQDGTMRIWGHDGWGQAGIGTSGGYQPKPVRPKLPNVAGVFLNGSNCFAVTTDARLYVWGFGRYRIQGVMKDNLKVPTLLVVP